MGLEIVFGGGTLAAGRVLQAELRLCGGSRNVGEMPFLQLPSGASYLPILTLLHHFVIAYAPV